MNDHAMPTAWAQHLQQTLGEPSACRAEQHPLLTEAEAARVQRHRDQLMRALRAQDRGALHSAKQQVLDAVFCPRDTHSPGNTADSPALRRALRDLSWRMAALLLPRSPRSPRL